MHLASVREPADSLVRNIENDQIQILKARHICIFINLATQFTNIKI